MLAFIPSIMATSALLPAMFLNANNARHFAAIGVEGPINLLRSVCTTFCIASCILHFLIRRTLTFSQRDHRARALKSPALARGDLLLSVL